MGVGGVRDDGGAVVTEVDVGFVSDDALASDASPFQAADKLFRFAGEHGAGDKFEAAGMRGSHIAMLLGEGVDFRDGIEVRAEEVSEDEQKVRGVGAEEGEARDVSAKDGEVARRTLRSNQNVALSLVGKVRDEGRDLAGSDRVGCKGCAIPEVEREAGGHKDGGGVHDDDVAAGAGCSGEEAAKDIGVGLRIAAGEGFERGELKAKVGGGGCGEGDVRAADFGD